MYGLLTGLELGGLFLFTILAWIGGKKASGLLYSGTAAKLRKKVRGQMMWAVLFLLLAGGEAALVVALAGEMPDRLLWLDRALLHAPLVGIPALWLLVVAVPRLWLLNREIRAHMAAAGQFDGMRDESALEWSETSGHEDEMVRAETESAGHDAGTGRAQTESAGRDAGMGQARAMAADSGSRGGVVQETLPASLLWQASHPGLVVPFQVIAFGAATAFYFTAIPPALPLEWISIAAPLGLFAVIWGVLWLLHDRRHLSVTRANAAVVNRPWLRFFRDLTWVALVGAIGALFIVTARSDSLLPERMDMMTGPVDDGRGTITSEHQHGVAAVSGSARNEVGDDEVGAGDEQSGEADNRAGQLISVTELTGPQEGEPDQTIRLVAEKKTVTLSSGKEVEAWTYNGQIPGPELRLKEGELVEVTLVNKDIEDGATVHWHGLDVPNAEDGVAGATQDAVMPGETYVYRFVADQVGTFWYHSHQVSREAVQRGLFGAMIVEPRDGEAQFEAVSRDGSTNAAASVAVSPADSAEFDYTVISHIWDRAGLAIGDSDTVQHKRVEPGTRVRLRLIHTDDWTRQKYVLVGAPYQVAAIDGTDLNEPDLLEGTHLELTTGGRFDVIFTMPEGPVFLSVGGKKNLGVLMSPDGKGEIPAVPGDTVAFDPTHYGRPAAVPFDAQSDYDRRFEMVLDNKLGFYNGGFDQLYTINGEVFPNMPMFMVAEGDLVKVKIVNRSSVDHPMHLHGHHVLVLSRNGEAVDGSPWWSDTLDVLPGETYELAFRADNPGLWMDHCHNLVHAAGGMTMHLMYEGYTSPFSIGSATHNHPE
ncbi:multicopper oxidase family protein [Paenibacillus sp. GCM10023252]|uniref:multicopper oxidase family protein n=1 Tax=Paenibacillus sp. GCM10023252 TaxID=3252649 RepID=UPI003620129F